MRSKLVMLLGCVIMITLLTGCFGGGGGSSSSGGSGGVGDIAGLPGGGDSGGGSLPYNPEPATIALLGSGLAAYALYHYKKNKKK